MGRVDGTPAGGERVVLHRLAKATAPLAVDPNRGADRLSASYLIALAARIVDEVSDLLRRALAARQATGDPVAEIHSVSACSRYCRLQQRARPSREPLLVARYHY